MRVQIGGNLFLQQSEKANRCQRRTLVKNTALVTMRCVIT